MKYSVSRASSRVGMLRRHGRSPSTEEVTDAYRELSAARIEREIREGVDLDVDRAAYLMALLAMRADGYIHCDFTTFETPCKHNTHADGRHHGGRSGGLEQCDYGPLCAAADEELGCVNSMVSA